MLGTFSLILPATYSLPHAIASHFSPSSYTLVYVNSNLISSVSNFDSAWHLPIFNVGFVLISQSSLLSTYYLINAPPNYSSTRRSFATHDSPSHSSGPSLQTHVFLFIHLIVHGYTSLYEYTCLPGNCKFGKRCLVNGAVFNQL